MLLRTVGGDYSCGEEMAVRDQVRDKLLYTACGSALTIEPSCSAKKCVAMSHTAKCVPRLTTEAIVFPKFGNDIP